MRDGGLTSILKTDVFIHSVYIVFSNHRFSLFIQPRHIRVIDRVSHFLPGHTQCSLLNTRW